MTRNPPPAGQTNSTIPMIVLISVIYLFLVFVYLPSGFYWSPDTGYKRIQADNIALAPFPDFSVVYKGQQIDPGFKFLPFAQMFHYVHNGQVRLAQTPIIALLSKPFILIMGERGDIVVPLLAGLISIYLTGWITERYGFGPAWAGMWIAAFGTPLIIYSTLFWEHTLTISLTLGAMISIMNDAPSAKRSWLAGALIGFVVCARKEMIFFAVVFASVLAWRVIEKGEWRQPRAWRSAVLWGSGSAVVLAIYEAIIFAQSGYLVPPELRINTPPDFSSQSYLLVNGVINTLAVFLFDHAYSAWGAWLVGIVTICVAANFLPRSRDLIQTFALVAIGGAIIYVMTNVWNGTKLYGIIGVSPFVMLSLIRRADETRDTQRRARDFTVLIVGYFVLAMLGRALFKRDQVPTTGPEWGLRYFLIVFVLSVPLAVRALRLLQSDGERSLTARAQMIAGLGLVAISIVIEMRGVQYLRAIGEQNVQHKAALLALPDTPIVTNDQWLAPHTPALLASRELYKTDTLDDLRQWVAAAHAQNVTRFTYVSATLLNDEALKFISPLDSEVRVTEISFVNAGSITFPEMARMATRLEIVPRNAPRADADYNLSLVASGLIAPTYLTHAADGTGRLFVAEKPGRVRLIKNNKLLPEPFLDISSLVNSDGRDQGLLSVAFAPDYKTSGFFWVYYSNLNGDAVVARYSISANPDAANPASGKIILVMPHTNVIHYAGQLHFGADGYLYISTGDNDTPHVSQQLDSLLGKILRIDVRDPATPYRIPPDNPFVNQANTRPEIWAYGLRNPWRFSFDHLTRDLYIADVGDQEYEEINLQLPNSKGGQNYGWNLYEGLHPRSTTIANVTPPVIEIAHKEAGMCAAVGGYVYRGKQMPSLNGSYLFGDFCTRQFWAARQIADKWQMTRLKVEGYVINLSSFGEDEEGELYAIDIQGGGIYKIKAVK